jgi:hypothetical protein
VQGGQPESLALLERLGHDRFQPGPVPALSHAALGLQRLQSIDAQFGGHAQHHLGITAGQGNRQLQGWTWGRLELQRLIEGLQQLGTGLLQGGLPEVARSIDHGKAIPWSQAHHAA